MIDRACISLNHRCNLRCKYCHFSGKEADVADERYEFTPREAEQVIENIAEYCSANNVPKFKLGIVGSGEPLLSFQVLKHIVEKARSLCDGKIKTYTITNGVCLTNEMLNFFYRNRDIIDVNFSLDGYEEIHNALRQGYKKTLEAIEKYESVFGCKPLVNATVTRKSVENADKVISYFLSNGFNKVNFSIVSDIDDPAIKISQSEYDAFIDKCQERSIVMRQKRGGIEKIHDCAKYGRLCGVGHTNIFITKKGVYPCGRFFGLEEYRLADYSAKLQDIEKAFTKFKTLTDGCCYFDTYVRGGNK